MKPTLYPRKQCYTVHYSFSEFQGIELPKQRNSQLTGFKLDGVAFFSLCNFLCTCHQNTKPRWVSVSEDEFVPFSFLGIASSGRSKTKIHLANYESDILGELSDMAFILTYHIDIITSHRQGAQTAAGLAHLIP